MTAYTKFPPVNIITNLMLADLYHAGQFAKHHEHKQVRAAFEPVVERFKEVAEKINRIANSDLKNKGWFSALNYAIARSEYNEADLRRKFIEQDGIKFYIDLYLADSDHPHPISDTTADPAVAYGKIHTAFHDPLHKRIVIRLLERRPNYVRGCTAETLFDLVTTELYNDRIFESDPARYITIAQIAADPHMILKFAQRPPQEINQKSYYCSTKPGTPRRENKPL